MQKKELCHDQNFRLVNLDHYLVGGLEHFFLCFHILGIIIPTDFDIFQRSRSTTKKLSQLLQD